MSEIYPINHKIIKTHRLCEAVCELFGYARDDEQVGTEFSRAHGLSKVDECPMTKILTEK